MRRHLTVIALIESRPPAQAVNNSMTCPHWVTLGSAGPLGHYQGSNIVTCQHYHIIITDQAAIHDGNKHLLICEMVVIKIINPFSLQ